jgi:prepilin-type N-terminal cleavage/methylation domain-containing protein
MAVLEASKRSFTLVELMIVITIITILMAMALGGIYLAQQQALETKTASNLRQCAIAVYSYARNNNGACPGSWNDLTEGQSPYLDGLEVTKSGRGVEFNLECAGKNIYQMELNDILISDTAGDKPSNQAVYGDGHVSIVNGS